MDDAPGDLFDLPFGPTAADVTFRVDLPLDPATMDVVCRRGDAPGVRRFNVPQRHVHHAPTGFKWGYGGHGPADFALNVLALFVPCAQERPAPPPDDDAAAWAAYEAAVAADDRVALRDGSFVAAAVWAHYQDFMDEVIVALPFAGGTIRGDDVRAWLRARGVEPTA